ncbi:MAG TPA: cell division protein FtsL [Pseudomonadales bacterium]
MRWANRTTAVLWLLVVASALAVVYSHHGSRQRFIHWQQQLAEQREFEVALGQLLIEKSSLTAYSRLEHLAAKKLNMQIPAGEQVILVQEVKK